MDRETDTLNGVCFEVPPHYEVERVLGHGAYGVVAVVKDHRRGCQVAIKKIPNAFQDRTDAKRILREVIIMRTLGNWNVLNLLDVVAPPSFEQFQDVYLVTEWMEADLHKVLYSHQTLTLEHVKYFVYQILCGLKYMHSAGLVHRDLKPSNILLNSNCDLKLCDFGLARGMPENSQEEMTEYVVTRWYRAPEVMLTTRNYDQEVDVWSVGCIMGELLLKSPLFPGEGYVQQLELITDLLGKPSAEELDFITSTKVRHYMDTLPATQKLPLAQTRMFRRGFPQGAKEPQCMDLLERLLTFNPQHRVTVDEALKHPWLDSYADGCETEATAQFNWDFEKEKDKLTTDRIKWLMLNEIANYHPAEVAEVERRYHLTRARRSGKANGKKDATGSPSTKANAAAGRASIKLENGRQGTPPLWPTSGGAGGSAAKRSREIVDHASLEPSKEAQTRQKAKPARAQPKHRQVPVNMAQIICQAGQNDALTPDELRRRAKAVRDTAIPHSTPSTGDSASKPPTSNPFSYEGAFFVEPARRRPPSLVPGGPSLLARVQVKAEVVGREFGAHMVSLSDHDVAMPLSGGRGYGQVAAGPDSRGSAFGGYAEYPGFAHGPGGAAQHSFLPQALCSDSPPVHPHLSDMSVLKVQHDMQYGHQQQQGMEAGGGGGGPAMKRPKGSNLRQSAFEG